MEPANMNVRPLEDDDYQPIIAAIDDWFGGRHVADLLPRMFFVHFRATSYAIEDDGKVIGFLTGFVSQTYSDQAYIHFVGVHPDHRRRGLGRRLYSSFFENVRRLGCRTVRCLTSPVNTKSIAFHAGMGFQIERVTGVRQGVPCTINYEVNGADRVLFVRSLC
jgi:ribosomal protein S18 acetylase RimI-like enzyme